ncbi:hypothetical protein CLV54_3274 [Compostimonas suwonensis]|uniref:Uncharacterized protein n=1 Tax=Compostimonas suwonensis TaxID=1048394 RepID=A0A2M9BBU2_9MICO|nr:hypothetical protein CLV54_3274 [Compostimonas suwonensis]
MTGRQRAGLLAVAGLVTVMGVTGCVPFACPAIGWTNALTVQLDGDTTAVDQVQLCTEAGCAPVGDENVTGPLGLVTVEAQNGNAWTFSVDGLPDTFTVRMLTADGAVLSDTEVTPEWDRVGGSEQCGGPSEATVTVRS